MKRLLPLLLVVVAVLVGLGVRGFTVTHHPTQPSTLGTPRPSTAMLALLSEPGPIELETINAADWVTSRAGLINLEHAKAKEAGLIEGDEPIQILFHVLRHPTRGLFLVDSGIEKALRDAPGESAPSALVRAAIKLETLKVHRPLSEWLAQQQQPVGGVFLTHLHLDHLLGLPDLPAGTPVYSGPGEASARGLMNLAARSSADRALQGKPALAEWTFQPDAEGPFVGAVDVFGDGSVWALHVPGHSPGSTAYLVRSTQGPVLLTGDACHTRWGWEQGVEPGTFTADGPTGVESLRRLRAFAAAHPGIEVRLGHQP
jgi:glyoxylase-like metal-dependent hydrolase (beta-lactamase superfamily II)